MPVRIKWVLGIYSLFHVIVIEYLVSVFMVMDTRDAKVSEKKHSISEDK